MVSTRADTCKSSSYLVCFLCFNLVFNARDLPPAPSPWNVDIIITLRHARTARQQSTQTVMTEGDIIEPMKNSNFVPFHTPEGVYRHFVQSTVVARDQSKSHSLEETIIKSNMRSKTWQEQACKGSAHTKKEGWLYQHTCGESQTGADISIFRLGEEGGSPNFKIVNIHKASVLLIKLPCYCEDENSRGARMPSIRKAVLKMWSSQSWMQQDHQTTHRLPRNIVWEWTQRWVKSLPWS